MTKHFTILNICKDDQVNQLQVQLLLGEEEYFFDVQITELGFSTPNELDKILMRSTVKISQDFVEILYSFQNGEALRFPVELNEGAGS